MSTLTSARDLPRDLPRDLLQNRDYTLILGRSCVSHQVPNLAECWVEAQTAIQALVRTCIPLDADGVTVYLASQDASTFGFQKHEHVNDDRLPELLQAGYPPSNFDFVGVLEEAIDHYFQRKAAGHAQPNGEMFLVILDGEPVEPQRLVELVVKSTKRMTHPGELALGIVQIGDDSTAQGFFQALDDDLHIAKATHDIVHTQQVMTLNLAELSSFLWDVLTD